MLEFIKYLLQPFTLLLVLAVIVLVLLWRKRTASRRKLIWLTIALVGLWLFCSPWVGHLAMGTLEWSYPPEADVSAGPTAIVVLSGGIYPPDATRLKAVLASDSLYRCLHAAGVYDPDRHELVILSGGRVDPERLGPTLAKAMSDFMTDLGIDEKVLAIETRSRNTYDNAVESAKILRQRGHDSMILVSDAAHMRRARLCFEAQGLGVFPSPCCHQATEFKWTVFAFLPHYDAARRNQRVFHEWLGLFWYWLRGWI